MYIHFSTLPAENWKPYAEILGKKGDVVWLAIRKQQSDAIWQDIAVIAAYETDRQISVPRQSFPDEFVPDLAAFRLGGE